MIKVYALSGSHGIGKSTTFFFLKYCLPPNKFAFVGEFADSILKQMNIRQNWKEKIFTNRPAYNYFENALDFCTIASYLVHKDKIIVADRSIVDNCAYRLLVGLPLNTISLLDFHGVNLYTFFMRSKEREDAEVTEAVKKMLVRFKLPYEEVDIKEAEIPKDADDHIIMKIVNHQAKETARIIADKILEMEKENDQNQFQNR